MQTRTVTDYGTCHSNSESVAYICPHYSLAIEGVQDRVNMLRATDEQNTVSVSHTDMTYAMPI